MALMRGHKQTDVGGVPLDWDVLALAKVCVKIQDGTHFSPSPGGSDFLYITSRNIRFGTLDISTAGRINAAQHRAIYARCDVKPGDLLLTKDGANTGNAALNTLEGEFSLLSSVAFLRFDSRKHAPGYFLQQILSASGQRRIKDAMSGNAITRLTLKKIRGLRFPVAPFSEQSAIAEVLGDVDALLGALTQLIAKKRGLKQAAMQQLLTPLTRLPGFGGDWVLKRLEDFVSIRNQKVMPAEVHPDTVCVELEHVGQGDGRLLEWSTARKSMSSKYRFTAGDVLFGRLRSYLRKFWYADRDGLCSTEIWPLVVNSGQATGGFLHKLVHCNS
ncbi:MAG TPA: hypothetical protein VIV15_13700 [Anaerolineales bacterium]